MTVLIILTSFLGVIGCFWVLALRLERDQAINTLVRRARELREQQERRLQALQSGGHADDADIIEVSGIDGFDVDIVDEDELAQAA